MQLIAVALAAASAVGLASAQAGVAAQAEPPVRNSTTYSLFHRVIDASSAEALPAWKPRGKLVIKHYAVPPPGSAYAPVSVGKSSNKQQAQSTASRATPKVFGGSLDNQPTQGEWDALVQGAADAAWYQLAVIEGESSLSGSTANVNGPVAATKLCQLRATAEHELRVHLSPSAPRLLSDSTTHEFKPFAVEYGAAGPLENLDENGCHIIKKVASAFSPERADAVKVHIIEPNSPALPPLRQAPQQVFREDGTPDPAATADGQKPEKSFLQKYWMYMIPVAILLLLPAEGSPGGSAEHDASSSRAPNPAQAARRVK